MTLIELFLRKGALTVEQRRHLGERLISELVSGSGAPADLIERARAMTWLVVHEPDEWIIGGVARADDPPRWFVRLSVPDGHLTDATRAEAVARITRVLAELGDDPRRLYRHGAAWVQIVEVPDGWFGAFGQIVSSSDQIRLVVEPGYGAALTGRLDAEPERETLVDPICGMTVELTDSAIVLEHDGVTHAFCSVQCREIFARQHATRVALGSDPARP